jgi:hypothetical protein
MEGKPLKAKPMLLFLLLACTAFASFGYSRLTIQRSWLINGSDGSDISFRGALVLNNSHQRVISVAASPGMTYESDDNGTILLHYDGRMNGNSMLLNGTAIVDVDYDTILLSDPPLQYANRAFTNITAPDEDVIAKAKELSQQNSSLATIRNLVNWVHSSVKYDVYYWGLIVPAREVLRDRKGVCVEYSHLLISLARSLGFDTRYVSGYAYSNAWQPHAWAEIYVPEYGWLPADATFGQAGMLDGSHVAIVRGDDQASAYDVLFSDGNSILEASDRVTANFLSNDSRGVSISVYPDNYTYVVTVSITNKRPEYVFGNYQFVSDGSFSRQESGVLLLQPNEDLRRYYTINRSRFQTGYTYTLPVSATFNDASDEKDFIVSTPQPDGENPQPSPCMALIILIPLVPAVLLWPGKRCA